MSYLRIIPSLLLKDKKLVKGYKFGNYKTAGNPKTTIQAFDSQKCDEIILIDLNGYSNFKQDYIELNKISKTSNTPLTYGGGINSMDKVRLSFKNGADKIYISSSLFGNKKIIKESSLVYGSQSIVGGINVIADRDNFKILNYSKDPLDFAKELVDLGVGEIKITFVNLEGCRKGFNLKICEKILNNIKIPLVFEGGIGSLLDIENALKTGVENIAIGSMLIFSDYNIFKIKQYLLNKNYKIRI